MNQLEKELHSACLRGDADAVRYYLERGANMNFICPHGRTAFGTAAHMGNVEILQVFINYCKYEKSRSINCPECEKLRAKYIRETQTRKSYSNCYNVRKNASANFNQNRCLNELRCAKTNEQFQLRNFPVDYELVGAFKKPNQDLVFFNNLYMRCDPKFRSEDRFNEYVCTCQKNFIVPPSMDGIVWDDVEVDSNEKLARIGDPTLYLYYTSQFDKNKSVVKEPLAKTDINSGDNFGLRALHYATAEGHTEAVRLLVNAGCKVNVGDSDNLTPLHMAAAKESTAILHILLKAGANVHQKTLDRISPLHVSASRGLIENVKVLLSAGAHVDTLDSSDRSPLFMAVSRSHQAVVSYLLRHGAKVNLEEIHGYTPLYEAVWQKNTTIVRMLLRAGAKITQSQYLLHYAILHRQEEMVELLIAAGSIINIRDENGDTPLLVAAKTLQSNIARLLLKNGASLNYSSYLTGKYPLHEVVCNLSNNCLRFHEMFKVLREFNVDLEMETGSGCTALCLAITRKLDYAAATLIRHGANVNHSHALHANLFRHLLSRENQFLIELFVFSGYRLQHVQLPQQPMTVLERWVAEMKVNPLTLCDLCRIKIRSLFKTKVKQNISKLVLPPSIKSYLLLNDIKKIVKC